MLDRASVTTCGSGAPPQILMVFAPPSGVLKLDRMGVKLGLASGSPQVKGFGPLARFNFEMHKVIQIRTLPHRVEYEILAKQN